MQSIRTDARLCCNRGNCSSPKIARRRTGGECGFSSNFSEFPKSKILISLVQKVTPGALLPKEYCTENLELLKKGLCNLEQHLENIVQRFQLPVIVAVNSFASDTPAELEMVRESALRAGAEDACVITNHANGGEGASNLAEAVEKVCKKPITKKPRFTYPLNISIKKKIESIAKNIYGAANVVYSEVAEEKIKRYEALGYNELPVCIAKTQLSFSHDPKLKGAPKGFEFPVIDIRASIGGGYLYPLAGEIQTLPGNCQKSFKTLKGSNIRIDPTNQKFSLSPRFANETSIL